MFGSCGWLMWFRMEVAKEVSWAGDPYAVKATSEFGERLYPRTSFQIWKEMKRGRSKAWLPVEIQSKSAQTVGSRDNGSLVIT
jgi:light-regulated signal transduction histidine kinase (bacteriophytochrome)